MHIHSHAIHRGEGRSFIPLLAGLVAATLGAVDSRAATTDLATVPLVTSVSTAVRPNLIFILDDSGSMDWDYMPDYVNDSYCRGSSSGTFSSCKAGDPPYYSSAFNYVFYNPAITYTPPKNADGSSKTSYNTSALWQAVAKDGYGKQAAGTIDLTTKFPERKWCSGGTCKTALDGSSLYVYPDGTYNSLSTVYGAPFYYMTTVQWCSSKNSSGSFKNFGKSGTCQSKKTSTYQYVNYSWGGTEGKFVRVDIVPGTNSYPYPGLATKATTRTDCAGSTCTYAEEMTNFANWYAYYRTRMQMMKTSASLAFQTIDNKYNVGYMSINNNTGSDFLNVTTFDSTQKGDWYGKLFNANPNNGTPLRSALSTAGLLYGGKLSSLNGSTVADPVQYSCQQNFAILSTDGYWNTGNDSGCSGRGGQGCKLDKTSGVGNQDNVETDTYSSRPMFDGGANTNASDTLADVAMYYYKTDLRPGLANNVPSNNLDKAAHQHMTTFTLGLGADGVMQYSSSYDTDTSGDYYNVKKGTSNSNTKVPCGWSAASKPCNWPIPGSDKQENIDDLWHAAVNGRGSYFSANNPAELSSGLSKALAGVNARTGASAAATTSNPNVTSGDNFVFSSTFTTVDWTGEMIRQQIDLTTGQISATVDWTAQSALDARVAAASDTRTIHMFDPTDNGPSGNLFKDFLWSGMTATEKAYFNSTAAANLSQWPTLVAAQQALAADANLVNFLRGQTGYEDRSANIVNNRIFRNRAHVLGDIVSAEAVYVKKPLFNYSDSGYATYQSSNASRQGMVYAAGNDGMLHGFNADSGAEAWSFVPTAVLPSLYKLADKNYATLHRYFVDGTPVAGDVYFNGAWRTVVVGGFNGGARGYYALDVTDPANPKGLWEFKVRTATCAATAALAVGNTDDCDVGYSYGNPIITKLPSGDWVVLVTSGYNNVSPGDGKGYLFVLNVQTGAIIKKIGTGVGDTTTPSGLSRINAWANDAMTDNTTLKVYGGDLLGNLWRFNLDDYSLQRLATLKDGSGNAQPITTKPELGLLDNTYPVVYVGTGRYLGTSDLSNTHTQSFYAIKDRDIDYGDFRSATVVQQTLTDAVGSGGEAIRTSTSNAVNWALKDGWYIDLPDSGERSNTDPALQLGTLVFTTNVPDTDACTIGGYSWIYFLDYRTGGYVNTTPFPHMAGRRLGNALATRPVLVRLPNNTVVSLTKLSDTTVDTGNVPIGSGAAAVRRVSWREIFNSE